MKNEMKITRMDTAMNKLNERITPDKTSPVSAPTQENILFRERRSAYSEGSALFIIYESEVTSLSSLIIPYKITDINKRRRLSPEPRKYERSESEPVFELEEKIK